MGHRLLVTNPNLLDPTRTDQNAELCVFALVLDLHAASDSGILPFVPPTQSDPFAYISALVK